MKSRLYLGKNPAPSLKYSISTDGNFEEWLKLAGLHLFSNELKLDRDDSGLTLETIAKFRSPSGIDIEVLDDEFVGIVIETTDLPFLEKVLARLKELEQDSLN